MFLLDGRLCNVKEDSCVKGAIGIFESAMKTNGDDSRIVMVIWETLKAVSEPGGRNPRLSRTGCVALNTHCAAW